VRSRHGRESVCVCVCQESLAGLGGCLGEGGWWVVGGGAA
jgi:hypothetical protein